DEGRPIGGLARGQRGRRRGDPRDTTEQEEVVRRERVRRGGRVVAAQRRVVPVDDQDVDPIVGRTGVEYVDDVVVARRGCREARLRAGRVDRVGVRRRLAVEGQRDAVRYVHRLEVVDDEEVLVRTSEAVDRHRGDRAVR